MDNDVNDSFYATDIDKLPRLNLSNSEESLMDFLRQIYRTFGTGLVRDYVQVLIGR